MRALQKLVRNGNSTQVTIPRQILIHLGWIAGESMIFYVTEAGELVIRRPRESDFVPPTVKHSAPRGAEVGK